MLKLLAALTLSLAPAMACSQAASTEVPIEPTVSSGAVIAFGVVVLVGIVAFVIFMSRANGRKDAQSSDNK